MAFRGSSCSSCCVGSLVGLYLEVESKGDYHIVDYGNYYYYYYYYCYIFIVTQSPFFFFFTTSAGRGTVVMSCWCVRRVWWCSFYHLVFLGEVISTLHSHLLFSLLSHLLFLFFSPPLTLLFTPLPSPFSLPLPPHFLSLLSSPFPLSLFLLISISLSPLSLISPFFNFFPSPCCNIAHLVLVLCSFSF